MSDVKTHTLFGETFELEDEPSEFAQAEFASAIVGGVPEGSSDALGAIFLLTLSCIVEKDQTRFKAVCRKNRAKVEDLTAVLQVVKNGVADRPTGLPSDSSDGQPDIEPKSVANSGVKGSDRLAGRPDLQLARTRATA